MAGSLGLTGSGGAAAAGAGAAAGAAGFLASFLGAIWDVGWGGVRTGVWWRWREAVGVERAQSA